MLIKTSSTEGPIHLILKKKAIQMLSDRADVVTIKTEHPILKRSGKYYSHVDVYAEKEDGSSIYVEVKSGIELPSAITQLMAIDSNNPNDEYIAISRFQRLDFFKTVWRNKHYAHQDFINRTKIYTYDNDYKLIHKNIQFRKGKEIWLDGIRLI